MNYKISDIADIINPKYAIGNTNSDKEISILLTDSRSLTYAESSLFFALCGKGNDGHRYIESLYNEGVRNFVVTSVPEHLISVQDACFIVVDDTTKALQRLAFFHRRKHNCPMVAITGSKGKTTVKEWIYQLLEKDFKIARSPRSYNSQIGVPLSLWELNSDSQLAIIEAGISKPNEMTSLEHMICPDIAIITNIEVETSDEFSDIEEKANEKAVITRRCKSVIYNSDNVLIEAAVKNNASDDCNLLGWSRIKKDATLYVETTHDSVDSTTIRYVYNDINGTIQLPFTLSEDVENGINALALLLLLNIEPDKIAEHFSTLHHIGTRLNVIEGVNNCSLIYDSYTSDFSSLWSALDFMKRRTTNDKSLTLILSDLNPESSIDDRIYHRIAELIKITGITRLIGIGENLSANADCFDGNARFFNTTEEFAKTLSTSDFNNELILIKGSPQFKFGEIAENLEARKHETVLEVNLDSVVKNFNYFRQQLPTGTGLVAMVKASGYGAGSYEIAKSLQAQGATYLAVAVLDEGIDLRNAGITMPIMVMNPKVVNYKSMFAYHLEPEIYNMEMLQDVIKEAVKYNIRKYPVHIKLDTGMHRMGFIESELPELMQLLNNQDNIVASSVFSHLATADCIDMDDYTLSQLRKFDRLTTYMQSNYSRPILRHILNSAGILRFPQYHYDMARLGIGLYGVNTLPSEIERPLATVSTLRTVIIGIREWNEGETIGYGRKGVLKRKSRIATIPIGYADGMNRHFGNGNSRVYINGEYAPTIGNICMDACMIDVTDIPCSVGDHVEIFGEHVSIQELADTLQTIPYEILTSVSPRVKRIYFRE